MGYKTPKQSTLGTKMVASSYQSISDDTITGPRADDNAHAESNRNKLRKTNYQLHQE